MVLAKGLGGLHIAVVNAETIFVGCTHRNGNEGFSCIIP